MTDDLLGVGELADRIGLKRTTVYVMSSRGQLPEPDQLVNGGRTKLWKPETIDQWRKRNDK